MRIVLLHNEVPEGSSADVADVLVQVEAIGGAGHRLGHQCVVLPFLLDLPLVSRALSAAGPDVVFNLVESAGGSDRGMMLAPLLLEQIHLRYTGAPLECLQLSLCKTLAKRWMLACGLPTPRWWEDSSSIPEDPPLDRVIVKTVWEHGSVGICDDSVFRACTVPELIGEVRRRAARSGKVLFAEEYVEGREFNLSVLQVDTRAIVLSPAEIDFSGFPADRPRIVGFDAKWNLESFDYVSTPRRFEFPKADEVLLDQLRRLALECWSRFRCRGYARVDFRVNLQGEPSILEVNANPCLSPDAGFAAAASRSGFSYDDLIHHILESAAPPL